MSKKTDLQAVQDFAATFVPGHYGIINTIIQGKQYMFLVKGETPEEIKVNFQLMSEDVDMIAIDMSDVENPIMLPARSKRPFNFTQSENKTLEDILEEADEGKVQ